MVVCPKIKDHQVEGYNRQRVDDVLFSKSQRKVQAIVNTHTHTHAHKRSAGTSPQERFLVVLGTWTRQTNPVRLLFCGHPRTDTLEYSPAYHCLSQWRKDRPNAVPWALITKAGIFKLHLTNRDAYPQPPTFDLSPHVCLQISWVKLQASELSVPEINDWLDKLDPYWTWTFTVNAGIDWIDSAVNVLKFHFLVCLMLNAHFFCRVVWKVLYFETIYQYAGVPLHSGRTLDTQTQPTCRTAWSWLSGYANVSYCQMSTGRAQSIVLPSAGRQNTCQTASRFHLFFCPLRKVPSLTCQTTLTGQYI